MESPKAATTQRAYTLRLAGSEDNDHSWRERVWSTHEAVNAAAKAFGDWLLTFRGGIDHRLAHGSGGHRVLLALSWLSVESERGAPPQKYRVDRTGAVDALRDILRRRGVAAEDVASWVRDCAPSLQAEIRDDAVWVNRSRMFEDEGKALGIALPEEEVWDLLGKFFGSGASYLKPQDATEDDAASDDHATKDFVQKAGQWLSSRFGTGEGADFARMAGVYDRVALWAQGPVALPSDGPTVIRALARSLEEFKPPNEDIAGVLSLISGPGYKSATQKTLQRISETAETTAEAVAKLGESATNDAAKCRAKVGKKGRRPWADALLRRVEETCGLTYLDPRGGGARHVEFSVALDHAVRRVSQAHSWIKRAEAERRSFEEDAQRMERVPPSARAHLDAYCAGRGERSGSQGDYRIRRRAIGGWKEVVAKWSSASCRTAEDRVQAARDLQDEGDGEEEKFGDIQLFEALAAEEAAGVWRRDGEPDPSILADYVLAKEAEAKRQRFKVPAYRHPDPLRHPVFVDFGNSRWRIAFGAHERFKRAQKKTKAKGESDAAGTVDDGRGLMMRLLDGSQLVETPLRWRSKRLFRDLLHGEPCDDAREVVRADRLGRATALVGSDEAVGVRDLFQQKDWNGRLQVARRHLDALADRIESEGWDARARRMRDRLPWMLTFSARLRPDGPWISYATKQRLLKARRGEIQLAPRSARDEGSGLAYPFWHPRNGKGRVGLARHHLSCLPGLRVLSVDLGHRYAAACAAWETRTADEVRRDCEACSAPRPSSDDLHLRLHHPGGKGGILYRRIGPDEDQGRAHPAPWALLVRQFVIKLQGEGEPGRRATDAEIARVDGLRDALGLRRDTPRTGRDARVDRLMAEAVDVVRRGIRRHGERARIARGLVATRKVLPGDRESAEEMNADERVVHLQDLLLRWHETAFSPRWQDPEAQEMWRREVERVPGYAPLHEPGEPARGVERRKAREANLAALRSVAEALAKRDRMKLHVAWATRWRRDEALLRKSLRWLRDWILPRGAAGRHRAIRNVGGLSIRRLATIQGLYRAQKAFFTRLTPEGRQRTADGGGGSRPLVADDDFGRSVLDAMERLRENRTKQVASRIVEAALRVGAEPGRHARGDAPRLDRPTGEARFPQCHAIVIENLARYAPDETRTRRENRALMEWSARSVRKRLAEACQLYGIHLREVRPAYTSRQDSRTGSPGVRCVDVPVKQFLTEGGYWATTVAKTRERLADARASGGAGAAEDRYLAALEEHWKARPAPAREGATVRVPRQGGEVFVSANRDSPAAKGLQADLNAAANIGLLALLDPDWPGRWWYVPCDATKFAPDPKRAAGSAAIDLSRPLLEEREATPTTTRKKRRGSRKEATVVNLWRDVSSRPLHEWDPRNSWRPYAQYRNQVKERVVRMLARQAGLGDLRGV